MVSSLTSAIIIPIGVVAFLIHRHLTSKTNALIFDEEIVDPRLTIDRQATCDQVYDLVVVSNLETLTLLPLINSQTLVLTEFEPSRYDVLRHGLKYQYMTKRWNRTFYVFVRHLTSCLSSEID